jgi:O-succinylbenzoate synthase
MDDVQWEWRAYRRLFRQPLKTAYGEWRDRSGILLKLFGAVGQVAYGEIAPVPWFGSEAIEQAVEVCAQMPRQLSQAAIEAIPANYPACQFGFESAWAALTPNGPLPQPFPMSGLLPAGSAALTAWKPLWLAGYRTFKWKIATAAPAQELAWLRELLQTLPPGSQVRLDANGGLTLNQAEQWLEVCDRYTIEYLEQPLPIAQFEAMLHLQTHCKTPIALDESVATLPQLQHCIAKGWPSVVVIKPAIVGSPAQLRQFCQNHAIDAVFSSVFETAIGRHAGLCLATALGNRERAMGYGTTHWFDHDWQEFDELWLHL